MNRLRKGEIADAGRTMSHEEIRIPEELGERIREVSGLSPLRIDAGS